MKKFISLLLAMVMVLAMAIPSQAAAVDPKAVLTLRPDKVYKVDMNGDAEIDHFSYAITKKADATGVGATFSLSFEDFESYDYFCANATDVRVHFLDINTSDAYKEILVIMTGQNGVLRDMMAIRYTRTGKVKVYHYDQGDFPGTLDRGVGPMGANTGKNKFFMTLDTPIPSSTFGCYQLKVGFKLIRGMLVPCPQKQYTVVNTIPRQQLTQNTGIKHYTLTEPMKLYKTASKVASYKTLRKGTIFKVSKMTFGNYHKYWFKNLAGQYYESDGTDIFVYVTTTSGQKGWICFPGSIENDKPLLKYKPGWN